MEGKGEPTHDPDWTLRWLFARTKREHHARPSDTAQQLDDLDAAWQDGELTRLRNTATLLRECAERAPVDSERAQSHLKTFLPHNGTCVFDRFRQTGSPLYAMVQHVADFRRRVADEQTRNEGAQVNRTEPARWNR